MTAVSETISVLHVDDEPDFAEVAATFLEREDIVEGIVDAHGWELRVIESPDGGARFEITSVEFVE